MVIRITQDVFAQDVFDGGLHFAAVVRESSRDADTFCSRKGFATLGLGPTSGIESLISTPDFAQLCVLEAVS
jgi:hypothetical protein